MAETPDRPPSWRPINHIPTEEEITAVRAAFLPEDFPAVQFARVVLSCNGGNIKQAIDLFRDGLAASGARTPDEYAGREHDRGQEIARAYEQRRRPQWQNDTPSGPVGPGPSGDPVVNPTDPEAPLKPTYDWATAVARGESGLTYLGTIGCDSAELAKRVEILSYGIPSQWSDFDPAVPTWALKSNFVTTLLDDDHKRFRKYGVEGVADGTPMTGQEILDREQLIRGGGRGPSGGDEAPVLGPGGNE